MNDDARSLTVLLGRAVPESESGVDFDQIATRVRRRRAVASWAGGAAAAVVVLGVAGAVGFAGGPDQGREVAPAATGTDSPWVASSPGTDGATEGTRVTVPTHCGVLSVTVAGQLWLADPPLGDHNPPPGWDEQEQAGTFTRTGPRTGVFHTDGGQQADFRLAPAGADNPYADCH